MRLVHDPDGIWIGRPAFAVKPAGNRPPVAIPDAVTVEAGGPPVPIAVLANDIDADGDALTLVSAFAALGSATALPDGTVLYTPPAGLTGFDSVVYDISDSQGQTATGQVDITLAAPVLSVTTTIDNRLEVVAATAPVDLTLTEPATFAGSYSTDVGLIAGGPANLVAPSITGIVADGETLTAKPGLWVHEATETPVLGLQWQKNGADIPGATGSALTLGPGDIGTLIGLAETLTTASGSRTATSATVGQASFQPAQDGGLIAWFDADDAATVTATGGSVDVWASKAGGARLTQPNAPDRPGYGTRTLGGRAAIDFPGSARLSGALTLPQGGQVALHMAVEIDAVGNAFAALVSMDGASADFQLDAETAGSFTGRLNTAGVAAPVSLSGGPFTGPRIVSILFDLAGGTAEVFIGGVSRASTTMTAALDTAQTLGLFTNRSQNADVAGAAGEVILTQTVSNRADYHAYLGTKWGIS